MHTLKDRRDALPTPNAHRHQSIAPFNPLQLIKRFNGQDHASRADRMPERNARSVRIGLRRVKAQILSHRASLCRESFIRLDHIDIVKRQPGPLQRGRDAGTGPMPITRGSTPACA